MKILKRIIILIVVIIALVVIVSYLLPGVYIVERSILIQSDDSKVFYEACSMKNGQFWEVEPSSNKKYEITGGCEIGAIQRWDSKGMRKGKMI